MNPNIIKELFMSQSASALYWTLLHSLWQGLIFGMVAVAVIYLTPRARPQVRYNILSLLLFLFLISVGIMFTLEVFAAHSNQLLSTAAGRSRVSDVGALLPPEGNGLFFTGILDFLTLHSDVVVLVWLVIVCIKGVKCVASILYCSRIKTHRVHRPSVNAYEKVRQLSVQLGLKKAVRLVESEIVKVPGVLGHLRPVIVVPLGFFTLLPPEQIEAILMHELAHIRRSDYLMNLLQCMVEMIFFFNPFVLWLSSRIRSERENCADEMAICGIAGKKHLLEALLSCRSMFAGATPKLRIAFFANASNLVDRAKRIVENKNKALNAVEIGFLASCLLFSAIFFMSFAPTASKSVASSQQVGGDTMPRTSIRRPGQARTSQKKRVVSGVADHDSSKLYYTSKATRYRAKKSKVLHSDKSFSYRSAGPKLYNASVKLKVYNPAARALYYTDATRTAYSGESKVYHTQGNNIFRE